MHAYRTHTCGQLRLADAGSTVRLSGWVHRKRDHGNLLFIDLRDHYGITQCVVDTSSPLFQADRSGAARERGHGHRQGRAAHAPRRSTPSSPTGEVELRIEDYQLQSAAEPLPLQVNSDEDAGEEMRLALPLPRPAPRAASTATSCCARQVIASIRRRMIEPGFTEFQTPILTSSSPEGARDYLVPSRMHPGKFYALPQAPQQFKQLLMVAGFDRYFQIAPCFRDEDAAPTARRASSTSSISRCPS